MFYKPLDKSKIKKVLLISLSNIGDVILTFPVIDILREEFPQAEISVVVGPKAETLLKGNPHLKEIFIFDKKQPSLKTVKWVKALRERAFDVVVDLRNTAIPFLVGAQYKTPLDLGKKNKIHMREKHIQRLLTVVPFDKVAQKKYAFFASMEDQSLVEEIIKKEIGSDRKFVVMAPGAANEAKRWTPEGFAQVADNVSLKYALKIVFVGDDEDRGVCQKIRRLMKQEPIDFSSRLTLPQLGHLLKYSLMAIVNDSAPMHLASYLDVPVLAIFGPSDPLQYGPWSRKSKFIKSEKVCLRCQHSQKQVRHTCMEAILSEDVLKSFEITSTEVVFKR